MLHNFLIRICGIEANYTMECRKESCIKYIRDAVGTSQVLVLVSGGVDSTVCAALLTRALNPQQVHAVHIDNGMQLNRTMSIVIVAVSIVIFAFFLSNRIFAKRRECRSQRVFESYGLTNYG